MCLEIIMVLFTRYCTIIDVVFVFLQRLLVVLEESLYIHNIRDMKVCLRYTIVKSKHIILYYCNKLTYVS